MPPVADIVSPLSTPQRRFVDAVRSLGPEFQRRGFATEAARAARGFAYGTLGWSTAVSYVDRDNAASIATALKLGCTEDPAAERYDDEDIVFRHPSPEPRP